MRNGRGPRTILRFIAIIAMNLFTINCACYTSQSPYPHTPTRVYCISVER